MIANKSFFDAINGARATKEEWAFALAKDGPGGCMAVEEIDYELEQGESQTSGDAAWAGGHEP